MAVSLWRYVTLVAQLLLIYLTENTHPTQIDVCHGEVMSLQCPEDSALVIHTAQYGRMKHMRCLEENELIGCTNDVLFLLDDWCSGYQSCEKIIPDPELKQANDNCWKVLMAYLDVSYSCSRVIQIPNRCTDDSPTLITATEGVLSTHLIDTTGCRVLRLQAMEGQTFHLTLLDFGAERYKRTANVTGSSPPIPLYGYIQDGSKQDRVPIHGGEEREQQIYVSTSNRLEIELSVMSQRPSPIMIQYKTLGCPELKPPAHAWYKRDGSQAVIGCEWSQTTWHLSCDGHRWSGVVGNCSEPATTSPLISDTHPDQAEYPLALLLTCVVSVAVVLVVILIVICVVCLKKQRIKQHVAKKMVAAPGHYDLDPSIEMGSILFFPNKPCDCPEPQPLVPLVDLGEQNPEQGQGEECNPLHIWEQPLPELPPKTKRKSTTDSTMGTRTGRTPGDGDEHVNDVMEGDVRSLNSEPFSTQSSHKYSPLERN